MRDSGETLNGMDLRFWGAVPLPLAEVGAQLHAVRADYFGKLLELAEDAVTLAGALGLARLPESVSGERARAAVLLEEPAFGTRVELLWRLERAQPGLTGWDPEQVAGELRELIVLVNPGSVPRQPRIRDVLDAIVKLRNDAAHRRLVQENRADAGHLLERAVFALIRDNVVFRELLFWVEQVHKTPAGGHELTACSLQGPAMSRYRRGHWQPTDAQVQPHRVMRGDPAAPEDLHPLVVVNDHQVYVLDAVTKTGPALRRFATREMLDPTPPLGEAWAEWRSPAVLLPPAAPPRRSIPRVATSPGGGPTRSPLLLALAAAGIFLVGALVVAISWASSGDDAPPATELAGALTAPSRAAACPVAARPGIPTEQDLPRLLTGAPLHWGANVGELETACGALPPSPFPTCLAGIVDVRETSWEPTLRIPQRTRTTLAFHRSRGLFEVMVYSRAGPAALAAVLAQRLGPVHRMEGPHRFWEYPVGSPEPTIRVKVSGLRASSELGRSAIKLHYPPTSAVYRAERRALDCVRR